MESHWMMHHHQHLFRCAQGNKRSCWVSKFVGRYQEVAVAHPATSVGLAMSSPFPSAPWHQIICLRLFLLRGMLIRHLDPRRWYMAHPQLHSRCRIHSNMIEAHARLVPCLPAWTSEELTAHWYQACVPEDP